MMHTLAVTGGVLVSVFVLNVGLSAQESTPSAPSTIDVSKLGPQVGDRVPDFSLRDQNGRTQTLRSIMGSRGTMLVFVRSADW